MFKAFLAQFCEVRRKIEVKNDGKEQQTNNQRPKQNINEWKCRDGHPNPC